jgi:DNA invertase Pin-like site-specific DNA recombinase
MNTFNAITIIYCRISNENGSTDDQEYLCKKFCNERGLLVNSVIKETETARYGFNNLEKLQKVIFNMGLPFNLVVSSIDRITRNSCDINTLYDVFQRNNIKLFSATETVNFDTPEGKLIWADRIYQAEFGSDLVSERVSRSIDYRKSINDHIGYAGYGYKIVVVSTPKQKGFEEQKEEYIYNNSIYAEHIITDAGGTIGKDTVENRQGFPMETDTHYNRRVLMYNIKEQLVVNFIKKTYNTKMNDTEFNSYLNIMLRGFSLKTYPIKFYKKYNNDPNADYQETTDFDKVYNYVYVGSNDYFDIPKNTIIKKSQKIKIDTSFISGVLNDHQITKRGVRFTIENVKRIALNKLEL